jgi:hypothetical protein
MHVIAVYTDPAMASCLLTGKEVTYIKRDSHGTAGFSRSLIYSRTSSYVVLFATKEKGGTVCVGNMKLIVIGYFRKFITYRGLVSRDTFYIARVDMSNENTFVKIFPENAKRESRSNF